MTKLIENPTYELPSGISVILKPVPPFQIHAITNSNRDKPEIPIREVKIAGKIRAEQNPDDPTYKQALESWENAKMLRIMEFMFVAGVLGDTAHYVKDKAKYADIVDTASYIYGDNPTNHQIKFTWLTSELYTDTLISDFQDAIMSLTMPTGASLDESKSDI